jgi:hypothetical protein
MIEAMSIEVVLTTAATGGGQATKGDVGAAVSAKV